MGCVGVGVGVSVGVGVCQNLGNFATVNIILSRCDYRVDITYFYSIFRQN